MNIPLQRLVSTLESRLPDLQRQRSSNPFANDVFEAVDDLRHLGRHILEGNTRVNYAARVRQERELWKKLTDLLSNRSVENQQRYAATFDTAEQILRFADSTEPPRDGHLGILRITRKQFGFVQTDYGFAIVKEEPIGVRFSSGAVYLALKWAKQYDSSCSFGSESKHEKSFWIDDLLFLHGDARYRTLPQELTLNTESDVETWFKFLADVFRQYGHDVLSNRPGIFEKMEKAQAQRDQEYRQEMDRRYGAPH